MLWYAITFLIAVFLILFIGTKVTPWTWETSVILTPTGITHFKKWLDLAGWVRLTYKVDFSKYESTYAKDQSQLLQVKKTAQDIILQNIDKRISALWVSDYNAYVQKLSDGEYIVVEIWWVQDLEAAKKLIGKTVELEFKVPNDAGATDETLVAKRQKMAEDMLSIVAKNPTTMENEWTTNASQDVYYNKFTDAALSELPMIYENNLEKLSALSTWQVYPTLLSWVYHVMVSAGASWEMQQQTLKWFTIVRYLWKKNVVLDAFTSTDISSFIKQKNLTYKESHINAFDGIVNSITYDKSTNVLRYVWSEQLTGQEGYNAEIYQIGTGITEDQAIAAMQSWDVSGLTLAKKWWISKDDLAIRVPNFSYNEDRKYQTFTELDATYLVSINEVKKADQKLFPTILIDVRDEQQAHALKTELSNKMLYSFEDLLISDSLQWLPAQDPKSEAVLNGTFFKYASVSQSQTGKPVVSIQFDDEGKSIFCNLTEQYVNKQMAIFVGGKLMTAPVIREKICGGSAQIDGTFDVQWARTLADDLNSWALPAPLILSHEETIAPSLGKNALNGALLAWWIWLAVVYFVMLLLYWIKKANIALIWLLVFLVYLLWVTKLLWIVSSLSAIAAIILSLGMAVDANVLMYERIAEERKNGKSMTSAIKDWYERSWAPIRDGNVTTGIIWLLLFLVWVNVFKWFGTMMLINMLIILFIIVPLTRELLYLFYKNDQE